MGTMRMARVFSAWRTGLPYVAMERWLPDLHDRACLLVSGERDNYVQPEITRSLCDSIGGSCLIWTVPGAKHNMARAVATQEYDRRIVDLFAGMAALLLLVQIGT